MQRLSCRQNNEVGERRLEELDGSFTLACGPMKQKGQIMNDWFWYAVGAAVLYGLHQVFTKLASSTISDGLGGFVVEGSAALTILVYLGCLWFSGHWDQKADAAGVGWSVVTGLCVGIGTIFFSCYSKRRPAFRRADGVGGRCGYHGAGRGFLF